MNWLDDFINSRVAKKVVFANYLDHLRMKNEARGDSRYASVEDALQDFAQRTGLTEMQKRGLRRQMFVKMALDLTRIDRDEEKRMVDSGDAPVSILPDVQPGTDKDKLLKRIKQKRKRLETINDPQGNTDVEDRAADESPGSPDEGQLVDPSISMSISGLEPWRVVYAVEEEAEEDPFAGMRGKEEVKGPSKQLLFKRRRKRKGEGATSRKGKILEKRRALEEQLIQHHMEPGGTMENPKWKAGSDFKTRTKLLSDIEDLKAEMAYILRAEKEKKEFETPRGKASSNNEAFLRFLNKALGVKSAKKRREALKKLSPEGLQSAYDEAMEDFRKKKIYYKKSQGRDEEHGDYVKCLIDDWINPGDPSILPLEHLREHAAELIPDVQVAGEEYDDDLIDAYLRKYPGSSFFSREKEIANFTERFVQKSLNKPMTKMPHIATEAEKKQNYTDKVLLDKIIATFRKHGVDPGVHPGQKTRRDLAEEVLDEIKAQINDEYADALIVEHIDEETGDITHSIGQIGRLEEKGINFEDFYDIFRNEVNTTAEAYQGELLRTKAPTRPAKKRWTGTEREEARQKRFKQLHREDLIRELADKLGRRPKKMEIANYIKEQDMVGVKISVTGQRGCWNCGEDHVVYVPNSEIGRNSAICPNCGVYREVLVRSKSPDRGKGYKDHWACPLCGEEHNYVIRDPNERDDPGGSKTYIIYCNESYIDGGEHAVGNSRYVFSLTEEERLVRTEIEDSETEVGAEQFTAPLQVHDRIEHTGMGDGRIVYIEGSHVWANFPADVKTAPLRSLEGEVIRLAQRKDPNMPEWWKVTDVAIDQAAATVAVSLRSPEGDSFTRRYDNLGVLDQAVTIAHEVNLQDLKRLEFGSRRYHRGRIFKKLAKEGCRGYTMFTVDRYTKGSGKYRRKKKKRQGPTGKVELLKNRVLRARTLRRLLGANQ